MASRPLSAFRVSCGLTSSFYPSPRAPNNYLRCVCTVPPCPVSRRKLTISAAAPNEGAAPASTPHPDYSDHKVSRIVDDISSLTLLQTADLVTQLKSRLNIQEIAMPAAAVSAAPTATATLPEENAELEKPKEKTIFNVRLESFDAAAKAKIIREVKAMNPLLTLVAAKGYVESLPKVLKENVPKDEAERMRSAFGALGAVVTLD